MRLTKKGIAILMAICLTLSATSFVFADNISDALSAVINKISILFDTTGNSNADEAQQGMTTTAADTKQKVDSIINGANSDIEKQLEDYKNAQLNKKNQEINSMMTELQKSVDAKKQEKLNEYKQKIDDKINSEYNKLINDLMK